MQPAALVVLLVVLSACALARSREPDRREELLSSLPPRSAGCVVQSVPQELPGADTVVDSAMLAEAVRALRRADPPPSGHVLLTLAFDREGINIRREVIEHSTPAPVADSIQRLVFTARRQVEEAEQEWGVRLRLDLTEPVTMRVGRREFCPPVPRDLAVEEAMRTVGPVGPRFRLGVRERTVFMRALVSEQGIITSAHVSRGELRGSAVERDLAQHIRQFLFRPATIDGFPTGAWVEIPLRVRGL